MSFLKSLQLLWSLQYKNTATKRRSIKLQTSCGPVDCDYYTLKNPKGLVVFIHGMNVLNARDPRLIHLASSFNSIGLEVCMPRISSISNLQIHPSQVQQVTSVLEAIKNRSPRLYPKGQRFALASISFSAGISLISVLNSSIQDELSAILLIGCFSRIRSVTDFFLYHKKVDEYGRNIILFNFVRHLDKNSKHLQKIFYLQALCASLSNTNKKKEYQLRKKQLATMQQKLSKQLSDLYEKILNDRNFVRQRWPRAIKNSREIYQKLEPYRKLHKLRIPAILIHGENDQVIPASESRFIADRLQSLNKTYHLVVTRLLEHGDYSLSLRKLRDIFNFARSLTLFIKKTQYKKQN